MISELFVAVNSIRPALSLLYEENPNLFIEKVLFRYTKEISSLYIFAENREPRISQSTCALFPWVFFFAFISLYIKIAPIKIAYMPDKIPTQ